MNEKYTEKPTSKTWNDEAHSSAINGIRVNKAGLHHLHLQLLPGKLSFATKNTMKIYLTVIFCLLFFAQTRAQQVDTIHIDARELLTQTLKPSKSQYLVSVHTLNPERVRNLFLWKRELSLETRNGKEVIVVNQDWQGQDTVFARKVYSISEKATFKPIYHFAKSPRGIEAFNFETDRIVGADSVVNNTRKGWQVALKEPTLNWELDLEILALLPFKEGKTFAVNFYHPGARSEPQYYLYKVAGSEMLELAGGQKVDCWKLQIDYGQQNSTATFWVSKKTREVLKSMDTFKGGYRYKVKLSNGVG